MSHELLFKDKKSFKIRVKKKINVTILRHVSIKDKGIETKEIKGNIMSLSYLLRNCSRVIEISISCRGSIYCKIKGKELL